MGRERDVAVIIILVQNSSPVRSTIINPFPHRIILIIERKMGQLVNEITFFTHQWTRDLLKSETKVIVDIDKLIKFLVRQSIANLCMQQGKSTPVPLASTGRTTL